MSQLVSAATRNLVTAQFGQHKMASAVHAVPTPPSPELVAALEADVAAAGGKVGVFSWPALFAEAWPLIVQYGAPMILGIIQAILAGLSPTPTPASGTTPAPPPTTGPSINPAL